jgi:hypothetical protein
MTPDPVYTILTMAADGREEERTHISASQAFEDYVNAKFGGWSSIYIMDNKGIVDPFELARRANRHAL